MSSECPTPGMIPMVGNTINGLITRLIRADCPESTKRAVLLAAATALILGFLILTAATANHIRKTGDVGSGAVAALLAVSGPLAILAGAAHANGKEDGVDK